MRDFWIGLIMAAAIATGGDAEERFTGSFRMDTGETITGGLFIERVGGEEVYLFMDTGGLKRGGVFVPAGEDALISVIPPEGAVRLELERGSTVREDRIVWHAEGSSPIEGRRIYPHGATDVAIPSEDGTVLEGHLLVPDCDGPHPVVVLVGGSGPTTRWGGPFETFFLQQGLAVLSYDKRNTGAPGWREPDLEDLASDAAAAVRFARSRKELDAERVGIWASSQGGWVAPLASTRVDVDFMIVRVGPGVSELEAYYHEVRQEWRAEGLTGLELDTASQLLRSILELASEGAPVEQADVLAGPWIGSDWYRASFGEKKPSEIWSAGWWGWAARNLKIEPTRSLAGYEGPVLWFLAEKDENVPLVSSWVELDRVLERTRDQELVLVPDADHAFFVTTGNDRSYTPHYWPRMREWLRERGLDRPECFGSERATAKH